MNAASPPAFLQQEAPTLTQQEFAKFFEFFYRKTEIIFTESKRYFVERRILERIESSQCSSFREYFATVRFETTGQEMQRLVNAMTVNETYFFREDYQFDALIGGILPELAVNKKTRRHDSLSGPCLVQPGKSLIPSQYTYWKDGTGPMISISKSSLPISTPRC